MLGGGCGAGGEVDVLGSLMYSLYAAAESTTPKYGAIDGACNGFLVDSASEVSSALLSVLARIVVFV